MIDKKTEDLEKMVQQAPQPAVAEAISEQNLEEYIGRFQMRYHAETKFRNDVHDYLHLGKIRRLELKVGSKILKRWHQKKTDELVLQYAKKILEDAKIADAIKKDQEEQERLERELEERTISLEDANKKAQDAQNKYQGTAALATTTRMEIENRYAQKQKETEQQAAAVKAKIDQELDAHRLVQEKVKETILASGIIVKKADGELSYDDKKIVRVFEELFLDEVIEGIEKESGKTGFLTLVKEGYNGVIEYWGSMETYGQMNQVNWNKSIIKARQHGRRVPKRREDFVVGVYGPGKKLARGQIDTAISVDRSSSMENNQRWQAAQKTSLSLTALMRRLNPQNQTYLSVFNSELQDVNTYQLMNEIKPHNGTGTNLALDWIVEKLKDSGPAVGYLITDGLPNNMDMAIHSAKQYGQYPNIRLRIILVDGNEGAKENIRSIGKAAGKGTRVLMVSGYQLAGATIQNLHESISQMYDIEGF